MIIKRLLSARTAKDIQHLQPAIDASRIYHQRTAKAETTNRSFLDVIFMSEKNPYGDGSKTVFREVKSHSFLMRLLHPGTPNI